MLTQYRFRLVPSRPCTPGPEWGYALYAALLERFPAEFGAQIHEDGVSPISQFLEAGAEPLLWNVTLLGEGAEAVGRPILEAAPSLALRRGITFSLELREQRVIGQPEELFLQGAAQGRLHRLTFMTPTAFKVRGQYLTLPTARLLLQSAIKRWNGCFPECPIEDENGEGLEAMARGLVWKDFSLRSRYYPLKGCRIPGFTGSLAVENTLSGFHRQLADALLAFSGYAGVGIKTTLGMGGVRHR